MPTIVRRHWLAIAVASTAVFCFAGSPVLGQADASLAQRVFTLDDRSGILGFAGDYDPGNAGYVRLDVARYRQNESTAICTQRPRNFSGREAAAVPAAAIGRDAWRNFLGANTISGTGVRVFVGPEAETALENAALSDVIFNQVTIPRRMRECQADARNGRTQSPLAPLASGTPTFAARIRRWRTDTVSNEAITKINAAVASAGAIAGLPVPIAERVAHVGTRVYEAQSEANLGTVSAEVFNPLLSDGGRVVRVFTGYEPAMGPNPEYGHQRRAPQLIPRSFVATDIGTQPYVDIGLITVASLFDQGSSNFEEAKARDAVQAAMDRRDILTVSLTNAPPARDTLQKIFSVTPQVLEAVSSYRQASTVALLEDRCNLLADRLQSAELGLSPQDAAVVLLSLATRHQTFGIDAAEEAKRTTALTRPCMTGVKAEVEKLGVIFPDPDPILQPVAVADRVATAERLNAAATAPTATAARSVVGGNLAPEVTVSNPLGAIAQVGLRQAMSADAVADLLRRRYSAIGCSLPTGQESADVADKPVPPVGGTPADRTLMTILVSEDGQQRYVGQFQFQPRAPADGPRIRSMTVLPLADILRAEFEAGYPGGCTLLPPRVVEGPAQIPQTAGETGATSGSATSGSLSGTPNASG